MYKPTIVLLPCRAMMISLTFPMRTFKRTRKNKGPSSVKLNSDKGDKGIQRELLTDGAVELIYLLYASNHFITYKMSNTATMPPVNINDAVGQDKLEQARSVHICLRQGGIYCMAKSGKG